MRKKACSAPKIFSLFVPPTRCLILFFCLLILVSCASYKLEKNLDPESKEFLSKVRYIITKQERKIFLSLPPPERENFIDEFWKKRDPDPDTEDNEFREMYFARIEEANRLFLGGGTPGWLQDRGRIYILLGPPDQRDVYPRGYSLYSKPMEIWYYGFFPIVFIDYAWNDDYRLEPLSARHISEINKAQMARKPKIESKVVVFDFNLDIKRISEDKVLIQIEIPYKNIWLKEEDNKLKTTLELFMEIFDSSEKKLWEHKKDYPISLKEEDLGKIIGKNHLIEILINLERGTYIVTVNLENKTDQSQVRKKAKFTV